MTAGTSSASPATDMTGNLLLRGMLIGILAGLLAFCFARVFGEPSVDRAIAFESAHEHAETPATGHDHGMTMPMNGEAAGHDHEEVELVSRPTQAGIGLLTATTVYSTALGGILALVFAGVQGRASTLKPRATIALLAAAAWLALALVPAIKYPPNPPAIGNPDTIGIRTALYLAMVVVSVAALAGAVAWGRSAAARHGPFNAAIYAAAGYLVVIAIAMLLLPVIDEVPEGFPADLLWRFRITSLGLQAVIWTTLGIGFGIAAERLLVPAARPAFNR